MLMRKNKCKQIIKGKYHKSASKYNSTDTNKVQS